MMIGVSVSTAQVSLPRPSPKASVTQTIGVTDVTITYNRPGVKGRTIWGDAPAGVKGEATLDDSRSRAKDAPIVPYGHIWRTGANEATTISVSDDVLINGSPLAAGTYSLHTIPGRDEWTIVFNSTANQWGSFSYDPAKDMLRVKAKPATTSDSQEWLSFTLDPATDDSMVATMRWEKVRVPFTIKVKDQDALVLSKVKAAVAGAKPDDWQTPFNAANYAKGRKLTDDAGRWYDQSLRAVDEAIKAKPNFSNYARRVSILSAAGKRAEAIAAAEKALEIGKAEKADTAEMEKLLATLRSGK